MLVYRNSNFWIRFLANMIDMTITLGFVISMYLLIIFQKETTNVQYIAFIFINIGYLLLYYIFFPIFAFGSTLGQHICSLKMISNTHKVIRNRDIFSRNILGAWYWILIFSFYLIFFWNTNDLKAILTASDANRSTLHNLGIAFISTLSSNWFLIIFLNYAWILFNKKKLGIFDYASKTRVVYKKQIFIVQENEVILVPRKVNRRKIVYFTPINKENKSYDEQFNLQTKS